MALDTDQTQFFESILFESLGRDTDILGFEFVAGGNVNTAARVDTDAGVFFVKWNEADHAGMFEAEAHGLGLLRQTGAVRTPDVVAFGRQAGKPYLVLEYINASRTRDEFWSELGGALAALHHHTAPRFGLAHDNYIGSLPQSNAFCDTGVTFFIERRLKVQAGLALYNGLLSPPLHEKFARLYEMLPGLLPSEPPALLHGDLWSGNVVAGANGLATLIDPAVYYGLREAELAFTALFGGFQVDFYDAYVAAYPLVPGYPERVALYNLYPLLVHTNLFGTGYLGGVERTLQRFVG